jgi:type VI secretion system secreted protein Hcp
MAAVDYFLKIDGIVGESQVKGQEGAIEVLSFSWGASQAGNVAHGGGGGAGKVSMQDFHFAMRTGKATPKLFLACANGQHFKQAVLTARKAGEAPQQFLKFELTDVLISSYSVGGQPPSDSTPSDAVSLNFGKVQFDYSQQRPDGSAGESVKAGWDLKQNKAV